MANVAVVGATGAVGRKMLEVLEERNFPIDNLKLLASERSAGLKINYNEKEYVVERLDENSFDEDVDMAIFSAGGAVSEKFAPIAAKKRVKVVDNSSKWRMVKDIPLVVPEINPEDVKNENGIIANPNCSTIQSTIAIKPLYDKYGIERIAFTTYQAVSGAGMKGVKDLKENTTTKFQYSIVDNTIAQIDVFEENGYTKEEMKMVNETKKIFHDDNLKITATAVRVPILNSHAVSINVTLKEDFDLDEVFELYKDAKGIVLKDDVENEIYPLQEDSNDTDMVYVGRIRRDFSLDRTLNLYCTADNIRKGAATNAVQIAELLLKEI
ncbi:MAG: aspartate-semialdehyde dehydrogenase [Tissierellia bacterium]|nr:aspartate-semialdehyde dehydrogenase [Tissierellia bacterium]